MKLTVPGEPVPKGRPRLNRTTGTIYTPKDTRVYEDTVAVLAMASKVKFGDAAVSFHGVFYCKKKHPDGDNLMKSIWDGLIKGGVIDDDKQIVRWSGERVDNSDDPRAEITVEAVELPA